MADEDPQEVFSPTFSCGDPLVETCFGEHCDIMQTFFAVELCSHGNTCEYLKEAMVRASGVNLKRCVHVDPGT